MDHAPSLLTWSRLLGIWSSLLVILLPSLMVLKVLKSYIIEKTKKKRLPPCPKPWPIFGNLPEMLANKTTTSKWIHKLMKEMNTKIACIRLGNVHIIPVSCPSIALQFFREHDAAFASRPLTMCTELVSNGYLTTALVPIGEQHKKMKRILRNDLFSPKKHTWLQHKRDEEADNLVFYVYNKCNKIVNVRIAAQHYCGNVIRKMIFNTRSFGKGMEDGGPGLEEVEYLDAIFTLLRYIYGFCVSDYIPCLRGLDLDGHKSKVKKATGIINKYHDPIIEERIKQWNDGSKIDGEDLLDTMISLKDANNNPLLTSEEIKAQIIELMLAAVDNPATAFEWALAEMINQPELLKQVTEELDTVIEKERLVQESDIPKLNFVKALIKEAFRLHPVAPFILPHVSKKDTMVANYFIPKGSHVLLSRQELGRNPKVWNEPHKFKPERHLKSDGAKVVLTQPDLKLVTFSTGLRGCPGLMLGTTMCSMLFARLLHGFTWSAPPNVSTINLAESNNGMLLAETLLALAKPRLATNLYQ